MRSVVAAPSAAPEPTPGQGKRSRTRRQLLDAALEVLAEQGEHFTIGDVAARAGMSHGTVYNYFTDRDELLDALVTHTLEDFVGLAAHEVDEPDPARRFARISARALAMADASPNTVRVTLRLEAVQRALLLDGPLSYLRHDLTEGHRVGRFAEAPDDGTIDVVVGALLLAARRVLDQREGAAFRASVIRRLLMALGLRADEAQMIAADAVAESMTAA